MDDLCCDAFMYTLSSLGDILNDDIVTDVFMYRRLYVPQSEIIRETKV